MTGPPRPRYRPLVSVILGTYNGVAHLRALIPLFAQTYP